MRHTTARRAMAALIGVTTILSLAGLAGTAAAGGKPGGSTCRRSCPTTTTSTTTTSTTTTSTTTTSTTTTAPPPTTTTTTTTAPPTTTTTAPAPPPVDTTDAVITDSTATGSLDPLLRTRLIQRGDVTGVLYLDSATFAPSIWFRDRSTNATAIVDLPSDSRQGWIYAAAAMTSSSDLWISGGNGPITVRHYTLSGSPLPAVATLVETFTFGNSDSRPGDLIGTTRGGVALAWHQQGVTGPQGQQIAYRSGAGVWTQVPTLTFMPSAYSDQVLAQHPGDGSLWLFANPDMWGAVGAARLTESDAGLVVDWTDGMFISEQEFGLHGPDPENPDLAVTADPSTGTIALAYQSRDRKYVGTSPSVRIVSRVDVARIAASGALSFVTAPVWAERVADVGLVVTPTATLVTYREVDHVSGALGGIHVVSQQAGTWGSASPLGNGSITAVSYSTGRGELVGLADDWQIHVMTR